MGSGLDGLEGRSGFATKCLGFSDCLISLDGGCLGGGSFVTCSLEVLTLPAKSMDPWPKNTLGLQWCQLSQLLRSLTATTGLSS